MFGGLNFSGVSTSAIAVALVSAFFVLRILAQYSRHLRSTHDLRVRVHELRLALKRDVAERMYAEERHRKAMERPDRSSRSTT